MKKWLSMWMLCALFCLLMSSCSFVTEGQKGSPKKQKGLTAYELIDRSLSSMKKMKGYRWESANNQQYRFPQNDKKNTRVSWKQNAFVTRKPLNIHAEGSRTVATDFVSQTTPESWYVMDDREYIFIKNRWHVKKRSNKKSEQKVYADPMWVLRKMKDSARMKQVEPSGKDITLIATLTGKQVGSFIDQRSLEGIDLPAHLSDKIQGKQMKVRVRINKENYRLIQIEQAVEFTMYFKNEQVKARQEWTHQLRGQVKKISIPRKIYEKALPYSGVQGKKIPPFQ
ncbi:hypothetical protein SAMN05444487_10684 [Marininema mesophilum]|uniref:Lipoprotein n=1 Tax=Marininema mesophilum TaxID=1048340 RepID=A0A1H2WCH1_9BACL|nr:DUF6612 family protein [Marininema mesophilum]SDW78218.1 hypothetical protein SAMN05444487_10684 [Marininema mesophilum]